MSNGSSDSLFLKNLRKRTHKVSNFNLNAWLEFKCLNFIRMVQSSYYHFKIKVATANLGSYFSLKARENNKEPQSLKVNSTPDLVKS